MPPFPRPIIADDEIPRRRGRAFAKVLLASDVVLLTAFALAWAVSETIGYSGRAIDHRRAWVLDVVLGEIAVWTGRIGDVPNAAATKPMTRPTTMPSLDALLGAGLNNSEPTEQLIYDRG